MKNIELLIEALFYENKKKFLELKKSEIKSKLNINKLKKFWKIY